MTKMGNIQKKDFTLCSWWLYKSDYEKLITLSWRTPLSYRNQSIDCSANQWTSFYMITASVMKELNKSNKYTMGVARLRYIAPEDFFLLNNLNPSHQRNVFVERNNRRRHKNDLHLSTWNTVTFGDKSVRVLSLHKLHF